MDNTYLGIDMGTSSIKIVLTDEKKEVIEQANIAYKYSSPKKGWAEMEPRIWYESMMTGLKQIFEKQNPEYVQTIGVTGQMHTLVVLDENNEPVRSALMWNDMRTQELLLELKMAVKGFAEGDYLSRTLSMGSPLVNLYWMKKKEPDRYKKIRKFMIGPDYLVWKLTGEFSTDACEASTSCLFLLKKGEWSEEIRNFLGLEQDIYPKIYGCAQCVGTLKREISEETGMRPETHIIAGTGDNVATAISTGCLGKGYPVLSLGTSGVLMTPLKELNQISRGKVIRVSFDNKNSLYMVQGAVQSNGQSVSWWVENILHKDYSELNKKIDLRQAIKNTIMFYPHIAGEKTIYADPELRGAFLGISVNDTPADMYYAVLEGLSFAFRELAEKMQIPFRRAGALKVVGGGTNSPQWLQLLATILNVRIEKLSGSIGPGIGISLLAMYEAGAVLSADEIAEGSVKVEAIYEPIEELTDKMEEKYKKYLRIHEAVKYIENGR